MTGPVFPAATPPGDDRHPSGCACLACIDALLAEISKPLVIPRPRRDPALADQPLAAPPTVDWLDLNRPTRPPWPGPDANRATRGPQRGAGRRPTGPGRRRHPAGGNSGGGCRRVLVALAAAVVLLWGLAGFAYLLWPLAAR